MLTSFNSSHFNFKTLRHFIEPQPRLLHSLSHPQRYHDNFEAQRSSKSVVESVISSITSCSSIQVCRLIHSTVVKCLNYNVGFIGDRLVSLYAKLGCFKDAHNLFDEIPNKDLVSWNSFISAFSQKGDVSLSLNAFYKMKQENLISPNEVTLISLISACATVDVGYITYIHGFAIKNGLLSERKVLNSLVNMYGKFGHSNLASGLFDMIQFPNLVSWNSIIKIHVKNGVSEKSISYFNLMRRSGIYPDQATFVTVLQGCADIGIGKSVDAFHGNILRSGLDNNIPTMTTLLSGYAKSGRLTASYEIFEAIKEPDIVAWTAMLAGYAIHGLGKQAIHHFNIMVNNGVDPDHVTFTHLLSACAHSGLVEEGMCFFHNMFTVYGVKPRMDHYSCMVDLFGRSGRLKDALLLIDSMPFEPNSGVWGALLNGCKVYGDVNLGSEVAQRLIALNPSDPRNYIMLSSIYSKAGRWNEFSNIRFLLNKKHILRTPGCSFIEHGNNIHRFLVGDQAHPESEKIYAKLNEVIEKIRKVGYVANTEFVLHDVEEEVKDDMINEHSEKLAIAFGLLVCNDDRPLMITKNLRICGDCHNMTKFVSLVEKRVIVIRDIKRFHHFGDGVCSCGDYW